MSDWENDPEVFSEVSEESLMQGEPDCWAVINVLTGTLMRGPFGAEEAAQQACDGMQSFDMYAVAPVYF
jgi:hypothetical protein